MSVHYFSYGSEKWNTGSDKAGPPDEHKKGGTVGVLETVKAFWRRLWDSVIGLFTGRFFRTNCSSSFDFRCHFQYLWSGWVVLFLAIVLTVAKLARSLHQKGYFDPLYHWWEDLFEPEPHHCSHMKRTRGHGHHRHSHLHGEHLQSHHARQRHRSHHHHHHHRREEEQPDAAAGGPQHRHDHPALGVKHKDRRHKHHRHGKTVGALHLDG